MLKKNSNVSKMFQFLRFGKERSVHYTFTKWFFNIIFFSDREGKTGANRFDDETKRGQYTANIYYFYNIL